MKETRVASRYAKSLLGLAVEKNALEETFKDMETISTTLEGSRELVLLLKSPILKADKKQSVLDKVFAGQLTELTANFIQIIVRKGREYLIQEIAGEFVMQYRTHKSITTATVTSAVKLDDELKQRVLKLINNENTGEVIIKEVIDPNLIGGFVVRIGDQQVDASLARRINNLKKEFNKNEYISDF